METDNTQMKTAKFAPGQMVVHRSLGYQGIIFDVDAVYSQSSALYDQLTSTVPLRNMPWYYVLVDGESHSTYIAETELLPIDTDASIDNPLLDEIFTTASDGHLEIRASLN